MRRHFLCLPVQSLLCLLIVLLVQTSSSVRISRIRQPNAAPIPVNLRLAARQAKDAGAVRVPPEFNINSGGPAIGRFVAEDPSWIVGDTSTFAVPDAVIGGAEDKNLPMYKSHRFGNRASTWGYDIPVMEPGTYGCTIHFAETASEKFEAGQRVFDLYMATAVGKPVVFENVDIVKELGGAEFTVLTKTAPELIVTGLLSIRVNPSIGDAIISGVTCERIGDLPKDVTPDFETDPNLPTQAVVETTPTVDTSVSDTGVTLVGTEININCGGPAIGRFIAEDYKWIRGETSMWGGPPGVVIGGAEEKNAPAVIAHRYGVDSSGWGYVIPLQRPGVYDCSLHFAETDASLFKVGGRVFDILVQDQVMEDIDVFRDAGNAPFTSVVKTFVNLKVGGDLMLAFRPKKGNAFVSAITCEKVGDLDDAEIEKPTDTGDAMVSPGMETTSSPEMSASAPEPSALSELNTIEPSTSEPGTTEPGTTEPGTTEPGAIEPVTSEPGTTEPGTIEPVTSEPGTTEPGATETSGLSTETPSEALDASPSPISSASPVMTPGDTDEPLPSDDAVDELPDTAPLDPELEAGEGEVLSSYNLEVTVSTSDKVFTESMKEGIKSASATSTDVESKWAITRISEEATTIRQVIANKLTTVRQETEDKTYFVTTQAVYKTDDKDSVEKDYSEFVEDEKMDDELEKNGVENVSVRLRRIDNLEISGGQEQGSTQATSAGTPTVVGIAIGCVLGVLLIVAVLAFVVVRKRNNREPSADEFDAPPPAMTESERSSAVDPSETGASVEYLDDDSTFTAATSRAGDNVDQVAFVKDVFGRGTADGAHGTA